MKLIKNFSHINLDGIYRLILLIYGRIMKKKKIYIYIYISKFMLDNLRYSTIIDLSRNRFLQQVQHSYSEYNSWKTGWIVFISYFPSLMAWISCNIFFTFNW